MPDSVQTQKEKDNLARIRENQRRSRARRKEYLQELESKWRSCEQKGVEATAEVQAAARQVLEENRRLRALLKDRGISEHEIENIQLSPVSPGGFSEAMTAAMNLETMLKTRKFVDPTPSDSVSADTRRSSSSTKLSASPPMGVQEMSPSDQRHAQLHIRPRPSYPPQSAADYHDPHFAWHDTASLSIPSVPSLASHSSSSSQHTTPIEASYHGHQNLIYNDNFGPSCPWPPSYDTHHAPSSYSSVEAANIIRSMGANVAQVADDEELCGVTDVGVAHKLHAPMIFDAMHRYSHVSTPMHP